MWVLLIFASLNSTSDLASVPGYKTESICNDAGAFTSPKPCPRVARWVVFYASPGLFSRSARRLPTNGSARRPDYFPGLIKSSVHADGIRGLACIIVMACQAVAAASANHAQLLPC